MVTREQSSAIPVPTTARPRGPLQLTLQSRENFWGYVFISPWVVGFIAFTALPMLASLFFSLTDFDPRHPDTFDFVGLANYQKMLRDPLVGHSLMVTLKFAAIVIPTTLIFSLAVAMLVNSKLLLGRNVFRTLFYMPIQIPLVASTIIWLGVLNARNGWMNLSLEAIGIQGPDWLNSTTWVLPGLAIMGLWGIGNMMLIFLAGLQSVPTELYEASVVDGAGRWTQFRHITLPMISPVLFYNLIIVLIGTFQYFTQAYVLTNGLGTPANATLFMNLDLYREGWVYYDMGYAAAIAWLLFVVVMTFTIVLFRTSRYWVYEGSGSR